jgi:pimeloyl-ACP methyl ester carboxylesterase
MVAHLQKTQHVPPERLLLLVFSVGGNLAASAAAVANRSSGRAAGLVLVAPANDIVMVRQSAWQRLSAGDACLTAPVLPDVPAPVLVIQGAADETLNGASQGRQIAQALGSRARYEELPGAGHQQLLKDARTYELSRAFLEATTAK